VKDSAFSFSKTPTGYIVTCLEDLAQYRQAIRAIEKAEAYDNNEKTDIYNLMGFCYFKLKEQKRPSSAFKRFCVLTQVQPWIMQYHF